MVSHGALRHVPNGRGRSRAECSLIYCGSLRAVGAGVRGPRITLEVTEREATTGNTTTANGGRNKRGYVAQPRPTTHHSSTVSTLLEKTKGRNIPIGGRSSGRCQTIPVAPTSGVVPQAGKYRGSSAGLLGEPGKKAVMLGEWRNCRVDRTNVFALLSGILLWTYCSLLSANAQVTSTSGQSASEDLPPFRIVDIGGEIRVAFDFASDLTPKPYFEIPPVIESGGSGNFFVSTNASWMCHFGNALFAEHRFSGSNCKRFSLPATMDSSTGKLVEPAIAAQSADDWRRSYNGVMYAYGFSPYAGRRVLITINHGENKNQKYLDQYYSGSVNTGVDPRECASGETARGYQDCWSSYNGFISAILATEPESGLVEFEQLKDFGPIIWPTIGYADGATKLSNGVRHPSAIVTDGYLYVFYIDTSHGNEDGREGGLKVARAKLSEGIWSLHFLPFFHGRFSNDNPSLPLGFSKQHIREFFARPGGRANSLWVNSNNVIRFGIARIQDTPYYLGAEESLQGKFWSLRLRISRDLARWGDPIDVPGEAVTGGWSSGTMHYPVFCDAGGTTNDTIDGHDFILLGTGTHGGVVKRRMSVSIGQR